MVVALRWVVYSHQDQDESSRGARTNRKRRLFTVEMDAMSQKLDSRSSMPLDGLVGSLAEFEPNQRAWTDQEFRQVLESAPDAMVIVDDRGQIVLVNAQTEQLYQYDRQELLGQPIEVLMPERFRDRHREYVPDYFANARARPMGACMGLYGLRKDGSEFSVEISLSPVETARGMLVSAAIRDVTERKQAEQKLNRYAAELQRANQELERSNRELQDFAYVVSHDLRAPLVNIQGFSKELGMSCDRLRSAMASVQLTDSERRELSELLDEEIPEALEFITASSTKMDSLLSGVLKLSRVGRAPLTIRQLDMNQILADIVASMQFAIEQAGAAVEVGTLPPCQGDQTQINQVFSNLLDNALKYLDSNRPGEIRVSGRVESVEVIYSVEDNGIGIAEEHQESIYKIFHRLNPQHGSGDGLGLTIVRRVLDRHNGKLWVASSPGQGSTFYVALPTVRRQGGRVGGDTAGASPLTSEGDEQAIMCHQGRA
jgi:chemotaxis family two-component system sensor kinase Cph1